MAIKDIYLPLPPTWRKTLGTVGTTLFIASLLTPARNRIGSRIIWGIQAWALGLVAGPHSLTQGEESAIKGMTAFLPAVLNFALAIAGWKTITGRRMTHALKALVLLGIPTIPLIWLTWTDLGLMLGYYLWEAAFVAMSIAVLIPYERRYT